MKARFHTLFLCALVALAAVSAGWAYPIALSYDEGASEHYLNMYKKDAYELTLTSEDVANGITSFKVYDDGGKSGYYSNGCNGTLVMTAPEGYTLKMEGSFEGENYSGDKLTIYNGNTSGSIFLRNYGTYLSVGPFVADNGIMTIHFESDSWGGAGSGLNLTVTLIPVLNGDGENGYHVSIPELGNESDVPAFMVPEEASTVKVYDNGGNNGNYSDNFDGSFILYAHSGYYLQLSGSMTVLSGDYLSVYDGSELLFAEMSGTTSDIGTYVSKNNQLKFVFHSDEDGNEAGFDLNVTPLDGSVGHSVELVSASNGSLYSTKSTDVRLWEDVVLTATPASGYMLNGISVMAGETPVKVKGGKWYSSNASSFEMPYSDVTVTPSFTNDLTAATLRAEMPLNETIDVAIPEGVASFKVYDDGGSTGNYSANASGSLVLTAPRGYVLKLTGTVTTDGRDGLTVYNGAEGSATLLNNAGSVAPGSPLDIGTLFSTQNVMTLAFQSNGVTEYAGLDLTVTVVDATEWHEVIALPLTGGLIAADRQAALVGDVVTLTVTTDQEYELATISAVGSDNKSWPVTRGSGAFANTATFVMQDKDVSVSATFIKKKLSLSDVAFGENGCLAGDTYFHLECGDEDAFGEDFVTHFVKCQLSQINTDTPDERDYTCWGDGEGSLLYKLNSIYDELSDLYSVDAGVDVYIELASNLYLGGYDAGSSKCRMTLTPVNFNFDIDGGNNAIDGFCYVAPEGQNAGFYNGYPDGTVKDLTFTNAHVEGVSAGVISSGNYYQMLNLENVTVDGAYVRGTLSAGGLFGVATNADFSKFQKVGVKNSTIEVDVSKNDGNGVTFAAGALSGTMSYSRNALDSVVFENNTVRATGTSTATNSQLYLGGLVGLVEKHSWDTQVSLEDDNIKATGMTVEDASSYRQESSVGGFFGYVDPNVAVSLSGIEFGGSVSGGGTTGGIVGRVTHMASKSFEISGAVVNATITGGAKMGGVLGYYYGSDGGEDSYSGAMSVNLSGVAFAGSVGKSCNANSSVGGLVGEIYQDAYNTDVFTIERSSVKAGSTGPVVYESACDGVTLASTNVGGIVGLVNESESGNTSQGLTLTIKNTYSIGGISVAGATMPSVGYIAGAIVSNFSSFDLPTIFNNYHYGDDDIEAGLGRYEYWNSMGAYTLAEWREGVNGNFYANVRNGNATNGITVDGKLGYYKHSESAQNVQSCDYGIELFPYGVEEGAAENYYIALGQVVKNGVASDADMKSGILAALMNLNPAVYDTPETGDPCRVEDANSVWAWSASENDGLPFFNGNGRYPSRIVMMKVESPLSLTAEQQSNFGFYDAEAVFEDRMSLVKTPYMVGATDAAGYVNSEFRENVASIVGLLESGANNPQQVRLTDNDDALVDIAGRFALSEKLSLKSANTYNVEYVYCATGAEICTPVDNVSGKTFIFTAPRLTSVSNDVSADSAMIPEAFELGVAGVLLMDVEFLDENNQTLQPQQADPYSLASMAFPPSYYDVANYASNTLPATKTIRFKYGETRADYPEILLRQASYDDYKYEVLGVDQDGEKVAIQTGRPLNDPEESYSASFPYGMYFVANDFAEKPGYTYESYTLEYEAVDGCDEPIERDPVEVDNNYFVRANEMDSFLGTCERRKWIRRGLTDNDTIDLTEVRKARLLKGDDFHQGFSIVANYKGIPYRIVFTRNGYRGSGLGGDMRIFDVFIEKPGMPFPHTYALDKTDSLFFPKMDAVTFTLSGGFKYYYTLALGGWSLNSGDEDHTTDNPVNVYTALSEDFIAAAQPYMQEGEDGIKTIRLYPVWYDYEPAFDGANGNSWNKNRTHIRIDCEDFVASYSWNSNYCTKLPGLLELSQKFVNGGEEVVWKNPVDRLMDLYDEQNRQLTRYAVMLPHNKNIRFDVDYRSMPGFKVKGVRFSQNDEKYVYDAENKTLELKEAMDNGTNVVATFDYEFARYNVTFDLSAYDGEIFVGRNAPVSRNMTIESAEATIPKFYVVNEDKLNPVAWSVKVGNSLAGYNEDTLLTQHLLQQHAEANPDRLPVNGFDTVTLFANKERTFNANADDWAYGSTMTVDMMAYYPVDDDGYYYMEVDGVKYSMAYSPEDLRGKLVLTQSYANADKQQMTHESELSCGGYTGCHQSVTVPAVDDTLTFAVSFKPDPGFGMKLLHFEYYPNEAEWSVTPRGTHIDWGYNVETDSLVIQPSSGAMRNISFYVAYTMYDYNISFVPPASGSGVFVANKKDVGDFETTYEVGWNDGGHLTALTTEFPLLFNSMGCLVGWKVDGVAASHASSDPLDVFEYATILESETDNRVTRLVPDLETSLCTNGDGNEYYYTLTLEIEGHGTLDMVQKLGDTYVHHPFEMEDGIWTLRVPGTYDDASEDVGVTLMPIASPEEGYVLKEITYNIAQNGNDMTVVMEDSATLNVMQDQRWHVKFGAYDPVYIAFDLALDAGDSSKVWLPSDAVASGEFQIAAGEDSTPLWTPYRADKCFAGWQMSGLPQIEGDGEVGIVKIITDLTVQDINEFSTYAKTPTLLTAVWVDYGEHCSATTSPINIALRYYEDKDNYTAMGENDSLVVTQTLGDAVFMHRGVGFTLELADNPAGYDVQVSVVPAAGYSLDASAPQMSAYVQYSNEGVWVTDTIEKAGEGYRIKAMGEGASTYFFGCKKTEKQFVYDMNAKNATVFYENDWNDLFFPTGVLRTDARLRGWALSRTSTKYYNEYGTEFLKDLQSLASIGMQMDTLYAVWDEYALVENVHVTNGNSRNGNFVLTQTVNGVETAPIKVAAQGIDIPQSEIGIPFNVKFEVSPGYYINAEEALNNKDADEVVLERAVNGGQMSLGQGPSTLGASVAAYAYKFKYNVNGGDANVFYGERWSGTGDRTLDDSVLALPRDIYRSDAILLGWSLDSADTVGVLEMSSELVSAVAGDSREATLYAVWEPAKVKTYMVTFENTNVGSLVLSQDVDDTTVSFNVDDSGLEVPVVEGGLRFRAAYTLKAGYEGSTDSLYRVNDLGDFIASLADGDLVVNENVALAIPTEGKAYEIVFNENRKDSLLFHGEGWYDRRVYIMTGDSSAFPLPAYLYTADACMVGWSLSKKGNAPLYTQFSSDLVEVLQSKQPEDSVHTLYAVWGSGEACDKAYNRISLQSANGTIRLVESSTANSETPVEHVFANNNTIIIPKVLNGNMLQVRSVADSSYVLDSLVTVRLGGEERLTTFEKGVLPFDLENARLVAYFGKSNRTSIAFVDTALTQSGNAVQFSFLTSDFEVTRNVLARVILETLDGEFVSEDTLGMSIVPPYRGNWEKFPLAAGKYVMTAILSDASDSTVSIVSTFEVVAEIAAVSAEGWQMLSIGSLDRDAMVWDDDAKLYWWDEAGVMGDYWQYKEFSPEEEEIDPTRGYWYSSIEGRPLILKRNAVHEVDHVEWNLEHVNSGWNLMANPVGFALDLYGDHPEENVAPTENSRITFYRWNADIADYEEAVAVKPYEAVWVYVDKPTEWIIPVHPEFAVHKDSSDGEASHKSLNKVARLAKDGGKEDWRIRAVLSDAAGHKDSWNVLGASRSPFTAAEPPEGMGDHVKLAIAEDGRALAKSVKAPAGEYEWKLLLNASSERYGELSLEGIDALNAYGLKVFVTVDGKTTEMHEGAPLRVLLKSSATVATVHVGTAAKVVAGSMLDALRARQSGRSMDITFDASEGIAGSRTVVELVNMDGRVVASRSLAAVTGSNLVSLDAPKPGIYMLRVRAGSQMRAGRILVK